MGLGAIVALVMVAAPTLVSVLGADPANFTLAVELTRLALPSILLLGIAAILTAVLSANQSFRRSDHQKLVIDRLIGSRFPEEITDSKQHLPPGSAEIEKWQ